MPPPDSVPRCNYCRLLAFSVISWALTWAEWAQCAPTAPLSTEWMAAILSGKGNTGASLFCGGMLISRSWVITAAHCVADKAPSEVEVVFGLVDQSQNPQESDRYQVAEILIHPRFFFRNGQIDGDIALLKLDRAVSDREPLRLLENDLSPSAEAVVVTWERSGSIRPLRPIDVSILSRLEAQKAIGEGFFLDAIPISVADEMATICHGDSGSPLLVCQSNRWLLAGITSYVVKCDGHAVFSSVQPYRSWVLQHVFPPFSQWAAQFDVSSLWSDDDGDGLTNFTEFGLSASPIDSSSQGTVEARITGPDKYPHLCFVHRIDADYRVEVSSDLFNWSSLSPDLITQESAADSHELINARSHATLTEAPEQFFRIVSSPQEALVPPKISEATEFYLRGNAPLSTNKQTQRLELKYRVSGLVNGTTFFNFQAAFFTPHLRLVETRSGATLLDVGQDGMHSLVAEAETKSDTEYELVLSSLEESPIGNFVFHYPRLLGAPQFLELGRQAVQGVLNESSNFDGNYYSNSYQILGGLTGDVVTLTLSSDPERGGFRPFIVVQNEAGQSVGVTTGSPTDSTEVSFVIETERTYFVFVSSFLLNQLGNFTLVGKFSR